MSTIDTIEYNGHTIETWYDEDAESPREWSNLGIIVADHPRYTLADATAPSIDFSDFESWTEVAAYLAAEEGALNVLPVYMIDHSGIALSTSPFGCPWDSGQVGLIYTTAERLREIGTPFDRVEECLTDEIATYSQYLNGEVYGYTVEVDNEMESCGGFSEMDYMVDEAKGVLDAMVDEAVKRAAAEAAEQDAMVDKWASLASA